MNPTSLAREAIACAGSYVGRMITSKRDLVFAGLARVETLEDGTEHFVTEDESGLVFDFHAYAARS